MGKSPQNIMACPEWLIPACWLVPRLANIVIEKMDRYEALALFGLAGQELTVQCFFSTDTVPYRFVLRLSIPTYISDILVRRRPGLVRAWRVFRASKSPWIFSCVSLYIRPKKENVFFLLWSEKNRVGRSVKRFFLHYFFGQKCLFYACFTLISSWEGQKKFRVGIFLNKNLLG